MDALRVDNISKTFRGGRRGAREIRALTDVSFAVPSDGIFGLLGMNGAGKSTAIKICTGVMRPDSGSVSVFGHDIVKEVNEERLLIGCSPQDTAVAPMLTVRENLQFIARIYGFDKHASRQRSDEIMERLMLNDRANDRANKLSGGLMRRLSIGMALISSPRLIFLDEPTLGLDVLGRRELWKFIKSLASSAAIVLTTHYLEEAESLCARVAMIANGRLTAEGTPAELMERAGTDRFEDAFLHFAGEDSSYE